jgi:hypothetical protein
MASYALPVSALPQHHHHEPDQACSSPNSHVHTQTPSLMSTSPPQSRDPRSHGRHSHRRSRQYDDSLAQYRANASIPAPISVPPPGTSAFWKAESTPGGRPVLTPTTANFETPSTYEPPVAARSRSNSHSGHDHSAERSKFTEMLLPYTARLPLLHAVMTDKDSRRIFYFMR